MPWSNLSVLTSSFRDFEKHYCVLDTDLNPAGVVIKKTQTESVGPTLYVYLFLKHTHTHTQKTLKCLT